MKAALFVVAIALMASTAFGLEAGSFDLGACGASTPVKCVAGPDCVCGVDCVCGPGGQCVRKPSIEPAKPQMVESAEELRLEVNKAVAAMTNFHSYEDAYNLALKRRKSLFVYRGNDILGALEQCDEDCIVTVVGLHDSRFPEGITEYEYVGFRKASQVASGPKYDCSSGTCILREADTVVDVGGCANGQCASRPTVTSSGSSYGWFRRSRSCASCQ